MGPLAGIRIVEFAGIGPAPMAAMLLAEMGATVLRIDRIADSDLGIPMPTKYEVLKRSRHIIRLDLKRPEAVALTLQLVEQSDALIEGFRPKVMERLGLGPDICLARNPRLVFGRVTGWGQDGPLAHAAGHDLNYIALTGALHAIGRAGGPPTPPLNLVGDFGGGALYLIVGVLAAIIAARQSGRGQVVDAAMVDGASSLMTSIYGGKASGRLSGPRGTNITDSGAYFYEVYECADGRYVSVAAIEAKFHAELLRLLEIDPATLPPQMDRSHWPETNSVSLNASGPARGTSGVHCWKAPTPASRRCCQWMRRRNTAQPRAQPLRRSEWGRPAGAGAAVQRYATELADPAGARWGRPARSSRRVGRGCNGGGDGAGERDTGLSDQRIAVPGSGTYPTPSVASDSHRRGRMFADGFRRQPDRPTL